MSTKKLPINEVVQGDSLSVLKTFPDNGIDMCMTSPPYWGLRDYGVEQIFNEDPGCEHEWIDKKLSFSKDGASPDGKQITNRGTLREDKECHSCSKCQAWKGQLGLEPTPEFYIEHLTEIFSEVKRVLKKEGTLWLNIGDTYSGQKIGNTEIYKNPNVVTNSFTKPRIDLPQKCLCMIPERLAWSLIQDGWILRNKIIWYKPNAMPSSVKDRFSNRYEFIYMFSQQQKYYFDLDAVREAHSVESIARDKRGCSGKTRKAMNKAQFGNPHGLLKPRKNIKHDIAVGRVGNFSYEDPLHSRALNPAGKNPGDVFEVNTQPFPEAHFAVFPEKLCEKPIKAGCPEEVCKECGKARERIVETIKPRPNGGIRNVGDRKDGYTTKLPANPYAEKRETGWTSCSCNAGFEGGIVLDPFCGAGTALLVAKEMKRRYTGIDIKKEFKEMSDKKLAQGVL